MSFTIDLRKFAEKTGANIDTVRRKVALGVTNDVIKGTPVDTGRAKGNWIATINNPSNITTELSDKSGEFAIDRAMYAINSAENDDSIWLVNNLPYIRRLEYGHWSNQAPNGMLRISVAKWREHLDKAIRELK